MKTWAPTMGPQIGRGRLDRDGLRCPVDGNDPAAVLGAIESDPELALGQPRSAHERQSQRDAILLLPIETEPAGKLNAAVSFPRDCRIG